MTGRAIPVRILMAVAAVAAVTGCGSSGSDDGDESASCDYRVVYEGHTYGDVANVRFEVGEKLGTVTLPACDDTNEGPKESPTTSTAYAVRGLDPDIALAVGETPSEAIFVAVNPDNDLPTEVKKLIDGD
ncbi:DUF6281 family protein [Streptomyces sp. NPDC051963]|uniref:DUF6281 family protein n=1 Tax=Streptomyces sp. NPDC051963 TaxID=3365678 RepID=UPI0037CCFDBE